MNATLHASIRHLARTAAYRTPLGAVLLHAVRHGDAPRLHDTSSYWDDEVERLYDRPTLNGRISVALREHAMYVLFEQCAPSVRRVLDLGCAFGRLDRRFEPLGLEEYVGVDLSRHAVEQATREHQEEPSSNVHATFVAADLRTFVPDDDASFDVILMNEVLKYLDVEDAVKQVHRYCRWLAPGGIICVTLTHDPKCRAILERLHRTLRWVYGTVVQQKPDGPRFCVTRDVVTPTYLIGLFSPPAADDRAGDDA